MNVLRQLFPLVSVRRWYITRKVCSYCSNLLDRNSAWSPSRNSKHPLLWLNSDKIVSKNSSTLGMKKFIATAMLNFKARSFQTARAFLNLVVTRPSWSRENDGTERDIEGVGWDMSIPLKLYLALGGNGSLFPQTSARYLSPVDLRILKVGLRRNTFR